MVTTSVARMRVCGEPDVVVIRSRSLESTLAIHRPSGDHPEAPIRCHQIWASRTSRSVLEPDGVVSVTVTLPSWSFDVSDSPLGAGDPAELGITARSAGELVTLPSVVTRFDQIALGAGFAERSHAVTSRVPGSTHRTVTGTCGSNGQQVRSVVVAPDVAETVAQASKVLAVTSLRWLT